MVEKYFMRINKSGDVTGIAATGCYRENKSCASIFRSNLKKKKKHAYIHTRETKNENEQWKKTKAINLMRNA